jgi:enamine deaminase RidA (YjgF/YER057c/UK114 family)
MTTNTTVIGGAESRLMELGINLPAAPTPLGSYVEAVQTGNLLFLSGMLPFVDHKAAYVGTLGLELDVKAGRDAARITAMNAISVTREFLGSLDRVKRVVRLGIFMATSGGSLNMPEIADGASDLFRDLFGEENMPVRLVIGITSLPLGVPVELEVILEIKE